MAFSGFEEFRNKRSLESVAKYFADETAKKLVGAQLVGERYCLGFHLRHVFDNTSPTVKIASSNESLAEDVKKWSVHLGLQTLNHVVDTLHLTPNKRREVSPPNTAVDTTLALRIRFAMNKDQSCHGFINEAGSIPGSFQKFWPAAAALSAAEEVEAMKPILGDSLKCNRYGVRGDEFDSLLKQVASDAISDDALQELLTEKLHLFACGCEQLLEQLDLGTSVIAYQSLMGALLQLRGYAKEDRFGVDTAVIFLRPARAYDMAVGVTLITDNISHDAYKSLASSVKSIAAGHEAPLDRQLMAKRDAVCKRLKPASHDTDSFSEDFHEARNFVVTEFKSGGGDDSGTTKADITSFMKLCTHFCDEQLEGRHLRFGVVMGNAGLMRFWPCEPPLWLETDGAFLKLKTALEQVHLIEGPENRCIVIPFPDELRPSYGSLPCSILELSDFQESLSLWQGGALWNEHLRPYVYFTKCFPWAVACVIGPHSTIRLFIHGKMVAYRDGKGWKCMKSPWSVLQEDSFQRKRAESIPGFGTLIQHLSDLVVQMSPYINAESHGGLVTYVSSEIVDLAPYVYKVKGTESIGNKNGAWLQFEALQGEDPLTQDSPWLGGRSLIPKNTEKDGVPAEIIVAKRLLRAAVLDGGMVICGKQAKVLDFRTNILRGKGAPVEESEGTSGTKAAAAKRFVNVLHSSPLLETSGIAIAFKVSSDGPITMYFIGEDKTTKERVYREEIIIGK